MDNTMSKDYYIELGSPPGMKLDFSADHYVKILSKKTDKTLLECIGDIISNRTDIHLCLSGGLDSQFSLMCCLELGKNVTAYTYRSFWEDTILNIEDVYIAEQLAKKYKFTHHIIDIDLKEFYDTKTHFKYGAEFYNTSPQIAVHFYFIELLKKKFDIDHIMLGGDPPLLKFNNTIKSDAKNIKVTSNSFFQDVMAPYYMFCESIGIECLRDIYYHSPEAVYKSYENNLDVIKNKKIYCNSQNSGRTGTIGVHKNKFNIYKYKFEYYKNIIPNLIPQKSETTGFETLKKLLAEESGIYNQYDILYRKDMKSMCVNSIRMRRTDTRIAVKDRPRSNPNFRNIIHATELNELYLAFQKYIWENDLECVDRYSFDF
ncbi:hypothetical protein N9C44_00225 [bacterium]|nr:hypothetical protein [bacterium]